MPPSDVAISEACASDVGSILALYAAAGITGERAFTVAEAEQHFALFSRYPFYRVFIAKIGARIVGSYEFVLIDNLAKAGLKTALVEEVAVDPTVQRRGIGKAMMLHARALAKDHGAYKLALSSNARRQDAHAFYASLGFEKHGFSFVVAP